MFKINLVVCLFYFLSSPSNKANTSWYVVEEGSLLHSVLLRHLVVDQDVAGAPLDWPGLGRDYRVTPVLEVGEMSTWYLIQSVTLPDLTMSWLFCLWVAACLSLPSPLPHSLSQSPTSRPATSYHVVHVFSCESNSRNSRPWSLNLSVSQSVKLFNIINEIIFKS